LILYIIKIMTQTSLLLPTY